MFTTILVLTLLASTYLNITDQKSWIHQQHTALLMNAQMSSTGRRHIYLPTAKLQYTNIILLIMIQSSDIELNPGPRQASIFPCGMCEIPVTWSNEGVCCDCCSVWHHTSCIELCTTDYELLQRSNVQWMCCKCDSLNVSSFTYHSYEI